MSQLQLKRDTQPKVYTLAETDRSLYLQFDDWVQKFRENKIKMAEYVGRANASAVLKANREVLQVMDKIANVSTELYYVVEHRKSLLRHPTTTTAQQLHDANSKVKTVSISYDNLTAEKKRAIHCLNTVEETSKLAYNAKKNRDKELRYKHPWYEQLRKLTHY